MRWEAKIGLAFRRRLLITSNGLPYNLTGCTVESHIRTSPEAPTKLAEMTAIIALPATGGEVSLLLLPAVTSTLVPGSYVFSVAITPPSGETFELFDGTFDVSYSVTRGG